MTLKFDKMHALGNDFVIIDQNQLPNKRFSDEAFFARLCDRHYGIGGDLLVLYELHDNDVLEAKFFNPDGGEAEICGNAVRCLGFLMRKRGGLSRCILKTKAKTYPILMMDNEISVDMGPVSLDPQDIGLSNKNLNPLSIIDELNLPNDLHVRAAYCVAVGNPHLILFLEESLDEKRMTFFGAMLENHSLFRNKINVSFGFIKSENEITLSVFERGAGLTFACGSGACASAAVAHISGLIKSKNILVRQKGGSLKIFIREDGNIFQTGPASYVFSGEIEV
ncbi:MAG: diaminopimelate epimerase [Holosporaceae bacterium]|jgi:diaminopimelate epimerase|nr:diaminopimelate epimerase [Holosporaceae bacterium]